MPLYDAVYNANITATQRLLSNHYVGLLSLRIVSVWLNNEYGNSTDNGGEYLRKKNDDDVGGHGLRPGRWAR